MVLRRLLAVVACCAWSLLSYGSAQAAGEVVVYSSVDRNFSEAIIKDFEKKTGIKVKASYDVEAAKTTGLVNRLIAEKRNPQADVFWNGESMQTQKLKAHGILAKFKTKTADPKKHLIDKDFFWVGFGGRARVLIVNTFRLKSPDQYPKSLFELATDKWPAKDVTYPYPLFGTTATHAVAMYTTLGKDKARGFFEALVKKGAPVVDGNGASRDRVIAGRSAVGITDTDDACGAKAKGLPVAVVLPDQGPNDVGTMVIPNTAALIKGGKNPDNGKKFIEYLLSQEVADKLGKAGWFHIVGSRVVAEGCGLPKTVKQMKVDYDAMAKQGPAVMNELKRLVIR